MSTQVNDILEVLLVEDDKEMCHSIKEYADTLPNINIINVTNNSDTALNYVVTQHPDAIILDLELQKGWGDGLVFLKKLSELQNITKPFILVTTNNSSTITHEQARMFGADYILYKYNQSYNHKTPVDFLCMTKDAIFKFKNMNNESDDMFSKSNEDSLREKITYELSELGIKHTVKGYKYIAEAILIQLLNDDCHNYTDYLANKYGKNISNINRNMQRAINHAWDTQCYEDLSEHYKGHINLSTGVPTVAELISYYTDKLKKD